MDLKTVNTLKRQLEQALFEAVHSFEHETGLGVKDVCLDTVQLCGEKRTLTSQVTARVEI